MKSIYVTVRIDFDTDDQEQAEQWAETMKLMDERQSMNKVIEDIEACNDLASINRYRR